MFFLLDIKIIHPHINPGLQFSMVKKMDQPKEQQPEETNCFIQKAICLPYFAIISRMSKYIKYIDIYTSE